MVHLLLLLLPALLAAVWAWPMLMQHRHTMHVATLALLLPPYHDWHTHSMGLAAAMGIAQVDCESEVILTSACRQGTSSMQDLSLQPWTMVRHAMVAPMHTHEGLQRRLQWRLGCRHGSNDPWVRVYTQLVQGRAWGMDWVRPAVLRRLSMGSSMGSTVHAAAISAMQMRVHLM